MKGLAKAAVAAALLSVVLLILGAAVYLFYPQNLARRPPELDALRKEVLRTTHLEADFVLDTSPLGEPKLDGKVEVVFPHVPPSADKGEIERAVRELVKQQLPLSNQVDVRFGDNLRTQPLDREEPEDGFAKPKNRPQRLH